MTAKRLFVSAERKLSEFLFMLRCSRFSVSTLTEIDEIQLESHIIQKEDSIKQEQREGEKSVAVAQMLCSRVYCALCVAMCVFPHVSECLLQLFCEEWRTRRSRYSDGCRTLRECE